MYVIINSFPSTRIFRVPSIVFSRIIRMRMSGKHKTKFKWCTASKSETKQIILCEETKRNGKKQQCLIKIIIIAYCSIVNCVNPRSTLLYYFISLFWFALKHFVFIYSFSLCAMFVLQRLCILNSLRNRFEEIFHYALPSYINDLQQRSWILNVINYVLSLKPSTDRY